MTTRLAEGGPDAIGVVLVGDELLSGTVVDSAVAWLADTLAGAGRRLVSVVMVPDSVERIAAAVADPAVPVGACVVVGGLGPTSDDCTRAGLAAAIGEDLVSDEGARARIMSWFVDRERDVGPLALRMAERPRSGWLLQNSTGMAPGVGLWVGGTLVLAVPGVPTEMRVMVHEDVLPTIERELPPGRPTRSRRWQVAGVGESVVAARLADVEATAAELAQEGVLVDVAYLVAAGELTVRLTVVADEEPVAARWAAHLGERVTQTLGTDCHGTEGTSLAASVLAALRSAQATVAVAESLTGGAVGVALTDEPGSSVVVRGTILAYATDLKHTLLGVPTATLDEHGAVSEPTALAMAEGVRERLRADWGVATTGVAGPEWVQGHPPGTVVVAVAGPQGALAHSLRLPGDRALVRSLSVVAVLELLRRRVLAGNRPA